MDKRYFLIIIIILICSVNLYMISNVSNVVGSASVDIGNYTVTLPKEFSLYEDDGNRILISNPNNNMNVWIFSNLGDGDNYSNKYKEVNESKQYEVLGDGIINNHEISIDSLFYQDKYNNENRSTFYFNKGNHDFRILIIGFDYNSQKNDTIELASDIAESIRINYKEQKYNI